MTVRSRLVWSFVIVALVAVATSSCGVGPKAPGVRTDRAAANIALLPAEGLQFTDTGQRQQLTVVVTDDMGDVIHDAAVAWSTTGGAVSVDLDGIVRAVAEGSGTVTARSDGVTNTVQASVSRPVPRDVLITAPMMLGREVEVSTDYGATTGIADGVGTLRVLVSPARHSLVRVRNGDGKTLLGVAPIGTASDGMHSEPLVINHRSTARALLFTHPFLYTTDSDVAAMLADVLTTHATVDALAGVVAAYGGVHDEILSDPAVSAVWLEAALAVLVDLSERFDEPDHVDVDVIVDELVAATASTSPRIIVDVSNSTFSVITSGERLEPRLSTDGLGMGVGYRFRHLQIDTSDYDSASEIVMAAHAFSQGRSYQGRSSFVFVPHADRPSTAFAGSTSWFKNLMFTTWMARGARALLGLDGPYLGTSDDRAYLVVGVTPGYGWFDRAQVDADWRWLASMPGIADDVRMVRVLNVLSLSFAAIGAAHDLGALSPSETQSAFLSGASCAIAALPNVLVDDRDLVSVGVDIMACAIAALADAGLDDVADSSAMLLEQARHLWEVAADVLSAVTADSSSVHRSEALTLSALVVVLKALYKIGAIGNSLHQLIDTLRLTPIQTAVYIRGAPPYRSADSVSRPPQAQLFLKPSSQVTEGQTVTLDASGSSDVDGPGIVRYRYDVAGGTYVRSDPFLTMRFDVSGTQQACVRVENRDGVESEPACQRLTVLAPPPPENTLPDLVVYDYRLHGILMGDANFTTLLIDHDEELELTTMWRNAASVSTPQGVRFDVGVFLDGNVVARKDFAGGADADYGGADYTVTLNTSRRPIAPGEYTLTMWVDYRGVVEERSVTNNTRSFHLTVLPPDNLQPSAKFEYDVDGLTVSFVDRSSDPDGVRDLDRWFWSFGDGASSTERNPTHTYASAGTYDVTLEVRDRGGLRDSTTRSVTVTHTNRAPIAGFEYEIDGLQVAFHDTSSDPDGDDDLSVWIWDFGDGAVSEVRHPVHDYDAAGSYVVTLVVADAAGSSDSTTRTLDLLPPPDVRIDIAPTTITLAPGAVATFTATVTGSDDTRVSWTASCGTITGDGTSVSYTAPANVPLAGTCTVTVTSQDDSTRRASATVTVEGGTAVPTPLHASTAWTATTHHASVTDVSFDEATGRIAMASVNNRAVLVDRDGQRIATPHTFGGASTGVDWSPDGSWLAVSGRWGVRVYDVDSGDTIMSVGSFADSSDTVRFDRTGTLVAGTRRPGGGGGAGGLFVKVWDVASGFEVHAFESPGDSYVRRIAWSPTADLLAAADPSGSRMWDTSTGAIVRDLPPAVDIDWRHDGAALVLAHEDTVTIVDVEGTEVQQWSVSGPLRSIRWGPEGQLVAGANDHGEVFVWNAFDGSLFAHHAEHFSWVMGLAWNDHGSEVFSGGFGGAVVALELDGGGWVRWSERPDGGRAYAVAYDPANDRVYTGGADGFIRSWTTDTPLLASEWFAGGRVTATAMEPNGGRLAADGIEVRLWDVATGDTLRSFGGGGVYLDLSWSPDGTQIAISDYMRIVDTDTGEQLDVPVNGLTMGFSPDGSRLAIGGIYDAGSRTWSGVGVYDPDTAALLFDVPAEFHDVQALAWSPDGTALLVAGLRDSTSYARHEVWSVDGPPRLLHRTDSRSQNWYRTVQWSSSGEFYMTAGDGDYNQGRRGVAVYRASDGAFVFDVSGHLRGVLDAVWTPDMSAIYSTDWDGVLVKTDITTGSD